MEYSFYWVGLYEKYAQHNMPWLFQKDFLAPFWRMVDGIKALWPAGRQPEPGEHSAENGRSTLQIAILIYI